MGSTTLNVLFSPNGQARNSLFSQALQIVVNNQSGMVKYGWIAS
jgi:hypothetical protein